MSELITLYHKNGKKYREYYRDNNDIIHGETKSWHSNGQMDVHSFREHGEYHGEYKSWYRDGTIIEHVFECNNKDITPEVTALVEDVLNITEEEKMFIKLTWGIPCLS